MSWWTGITYHHREPITVPADFFSAEKGRFAIKLIAFCEPAAVGDSCFVSTANDIVFDYQVMDGDTVRLTPH